MRSTKTANLLQTLLLDSARDSPLGSNEGAIAESVHPFGSVTPYRLGDQCRPVMYSATSLTAADQRNQPQDLHSRIPRFWFGTQVHVSICAQTNQLPLAKVHTSLKRYRNQFDRRCGSHACGRIPYLEPRPAGVMARAGPGSGPSVSVLLC
jgi:hypothetical protein